MKLPFHNWRTVKVHSGSLMFSSIIMILMAGIMGYLTDWRLGVGFGSIGVYQGMMAILYNYSRSYDE